MDSEQSGGSGKLANAEASHRYVCRCDARWQDLYLYLGRKAAPGARGRDGPRTRGGSGTAGNSEQPGAVVAFAQQPRYRHGPFYTRYLVPGIDQV